MPSCLTEIVENSISIELPSNWYNSKWIGLAFWASESTIWARYGIRAREVAVGKMPQNHSAFEVFTTGINVEVLTKIRSIITYCICLAMSGLLLLGMVNAVRLRLYLRAVSCMR